MARTTGASDDIPSHLVLWDVDHTLIETRGVGRELFAQAFERATGQPMQAMADVHGRTEPTIMSDTLQLHGLDPSGPLLAAFADELAGAYEQESSKLQERGRALPGARSALEALADRAEVVSSVLTGNLHRVTITKLSVFGLASLVDLEVGAYGSDDPDRPTLVAVARRRASAKFATTFDATSTTLVGDTPLDVAAGLQAGAHVLGVATGRSSTSELKAAGAHTVVPDLTDLDAVLAGVLPDSDLQP